MKTRKTVLFLVCLLSLSACHTTEKLSLRFIAASSPPLVVSDAHGSVTGANVDLFNEAARRAGYAIEWVAVNGNPVELLLSGDADLFHALPLEPAPPPRLHATKPWIRSEYAVLVLQGKNRLASDLRVTLINHPIDREVRRRLFPNAKFTFTRTHAEGLSAICDGRADALVTSPRLAQTILMDCHMPGMSGLEATRRIRDFELGGKRTPVVALTADVTVENRDRCRAAGMDDFLGKPLHSDALATLMSLWLTRN